MYKNLMMTFLSAFACFGGLRGQDLRVNELEYFEGRGVNVLVFSNQYNGMFFDEKTAGIELIHHGVRTATGGAVRLQNTPEQWDLVPELINRKVDREQNSMMVTLRYEEFDFSPAVKVTAKGGGVEIEVWLDRPVPEKLVGKAGLNLEFLPSAYFGKSYLADGQPGYFPRYPSGNTRLEKEINKIPQFGGHTTFDDRGRDEFIVPEPIAAGRELVMAPEDPERRVKIGTTDADLMLFDGRSLAQNGWFIVRSLLPANRTGKVLSWYLEPHAVAGWIRKPVIGFSQVGYTPGQDKVAVIEMDKNDRPLKTAAVFQVTADGKAVEKLKGAVKLWGDFLRYRYAKFDFSGIREEGIYYIQYGDQITNTFVVGAEVYARVWHPTLDVWFPVQMDHMQVNEAYRVWHGAPFLDDCLQAPLHVEHFDGYSMGDTTDTRYKPLERIPGMAVGGWFDAGDFDIQTGSHNSVITDFVRIWEDFGVRRDMTYIDQKTRYVDIHRPDGKPDLLQQIEHGTLNLVAQCEHIGHPVRGIVVPNLHQYHHLGDAVTETDNLPWDPGLKPFETDGNSSGTPDDRWAFTSRSAFLDYHTAAALAAASRALRGYNDQLAARSLSCAERLVREADAATKGRAARDNDPMGMMSRSSGTDAVFQLYLATGDKAWLDRFQRQIGTLPEPGTGGPGGGFFFAGRILLTALKALPYLDAAYKTKLRDYVVKYRESLRELERQNPYGVPVTFGGWGGSGAVVTFAVVNYYAHQAFPDLIGKEDVFKGVHYIFGCHPYSNVSFVNAVGMRSKKVAYGNNRADFTTIAGGIVPGLMLLKPDFLENKDDWPFFWGENEVTIGGSAGYILLSCAVSELVK